MGEFDAVAVLDLGLALSEVDAEAGVGVLEHEQGQGAVVVQAEVVAGGAVAVGASKPAAEGLKTAAEHGPVAGVMGEKGSAENAVVHGCVLSHG